METGLDELIESLLTEIAFSGVRGCSVSALLKAIDSFYSQARGELHKSTRTHHNEAHKPGDANDGITNSNNAAPSQRSHTEYDISTGSKVWGWLVARKDVSVGTDRQFNHLSLEEVLALPEEDDSSAPADDTKAPKTVGSTPAKNQRSSKSSRESKAASQKWRPHLYVSEERQWKALAGHGPDLKRIPLFEWRALVDIASVREEGILQGDLVRLSGQDKRSLPTRTDALAKKGYVIKQPVILRGCRSSKLWLAQFAGSAKQGRDGLNFDKLDLSKNALAKDFTPVPFSDSWNGEKLDYIAIAQAFNAVLKAWGIMRYCDMRTKLDANRVPQMRALAKTSRWFTSIGAATFVAARFAHGQKLFKDCIKFIREPTTEEWKVFRTTPTAHIKVPSARLGKRGQASRAKHNKEAKPSGHSQVKSKKPSDEESRNNPQNEELIASLWIPYKPMINTAFEIIKRAGLEGSSNGELGHVTLGHNYRKYIAALTGSLSVPNSQPPHIKHFDITSQLNRLGKTMTYQFFTTDEISDVTKESNQENGVEDQEDAVAQISGAGSLNRDLVAPARQYAFSSFLKSKFAPISNSSFSQLHSKLLRSRPKQSRKRKRIVDNEPTLGDHARRNKKPRRGEPPSAEGERFDSRGGESGFMSILKSELPMNDIEVPISSPSPPPRPSGVHREPDNMLDPPGKKGRRKRSIVLTFKFDSLKDQSFLERMRNKRPANSEENPRSQNETPPAVGDDPTVSETPDTAKTKLKPTKRNGKTVYRCDKCGNSWKNSNGLEYHINKSRTTCNPDYVPGPPPPPKLSPKPKPALKVATTQTPAAPNEDQTPSPKRLLESARKSKQRNSGAEDRRPVLPSKRVRIIEDHTHDRDSVNAQISHSIQNPIVLQDLEAYDVIDRRRRRERTHASHQLRQMSQVLPQAVSERLETSKASKKSDSGTRNEPPKDTLVEITQANATSRHTTPATKQKAKAKGKSQVQDKSSRPRTKLPEVPNATPTTSDFNLRPTPIKPTTAAVDSPIVANAAANDQGSGDASGNPKKSRKSYTQTLGALRRERTMNIIHYFLDNNDGVFPGQRSLYLTLVSVWNKRHNDLEPPDPKVCQTVVNTMERTGALTQVRFFFLDDNGKLQDCCVLVKNKSDAASTTDLATNPKVVILKEKMREMFPEPYVPEAFSSSQEDNEFDPNDDTQHGNEIRKVQRNSSATDDIEVLPYSVRFIRDPPPSAGLKRHAEDEVARASSPAKKARVSVRDTNKPRNTPKSRKRGESLQASQDAKYSWSQEQNPDEKWDQIQANLQDFSTGAWSMLPQGVTPSEVSREKPLSSIRRRLSGKSKPSNKTRAEPFEAIFWDHDSQHDDFDKSKAEDSASEDEDDVVMTDIRRRDSADDDENPTAEHTSLRFTKYKKLRGTQAGCWPWLPASFFESNSASFVLDGEMPHATWFQRENLPHNAEEIIKSFRKRRQFSSWADPWYGKFVWDVNTIEKWELSHENKWLLTVGSIAPDYRFISLSPDTSQVNMKPIALEWPSQNQYTTENIPDEVKNASPDDDDAGLPEMVNRARGRPKKKQETNKMGPVKKSTPVPHIEIQYTTRSLKPIPIQNRGRVNKPHPNEEKLGLSGETELIAAFVVFKTLLGGVDRKIDIGSILKTFPQFSHSSLKKFWPKACKERKTYIDALTSKFQSAFLEAYEAGDIPPLDYDDIDSYDWRSLILWAANLETHENVYLPELRNELEESYSLDDAINEAPDWRERWYQNLASIYSRVEATSSEPISIPVGGGVTAEEILLSRARSWVRSLCITPIKGVNTPDEIRVKLLRLSGGSEAEANKLLKKVVNQLTSERIAARSKGKILGQSLRLHGVFQKQLKKASIVEKFVQAANFKVLLDESFRRGEGYDLPYVADDGTTMAVLNLQALGRIRVESVDIPHIPFGFEPGNYDGRTFPKSYYHFNVRLFPTESYMYDKDLPVLGQAVRMKAPQEGPHGEIPIWVDFFGKFDKKRWVTYFTMMTLALATKGPLTPYTASVLMKPFVEPFEAKLIMDWIDGLGLLERFDSDQSATVGEWWWLVAGKLALDWKGKDVAQA
ncbi:uncharacterized protein F4822DRAFT_396600 [Hypoxylon trugodes]|uniref:uncharacterized protein n=1 Tax=Hypoxylon trugodes TaxID=326681 RepID=UPI00219D7A25|nr:uncharacterized protein F4822DRAFT_396600 [Hypoxylon trugodes]KAI1391398.1 hypothetical protein F4822DRAFT_396600 [Hypoxylon trugodes]